LIPLKLGKVLVSCLISVNAKGALTDND
jgi:hypothetical protein